MLTLLNYLLHHFLDELRADLSISSGLNLFRSRSTILLRNEMTIFVDRIIMAHKAKFMSGRRQAHMVMVIFFIDIHRANIFMHHCRSFNFNLVSITALRGVRIVFNMHGMNLNSVCGDRLHGQLYFFVLSMVILIHIAQVWMV